MSKSGSEIITHWKNLFEVASDAHLAALIGLSAEDQKPYRQKLVDEVALIGAENPLGSLFTDWSATTEGIVAMIKEGQEDARLRLRQIPASQRKIDSTNLPSFLRPRKPVV